MRFYELQDTVNSDILDRVLAMFTANELPSDRSALIDDMNVLVHETVDSQLIYTADIHALWDDLGNPEPENSELGEHDTINDAITAAVYDAAITEIDPYDAVDAALDEILDRILTGEYSVTWTEPELKDEIMTDLDVATDHEDLFDAIVNFRAAVEI